VVYFVGKVNLSFCTTGYATVYTHAREDVWYVLIQFKTCINWV